MNNADFQTGFIVGMLSGSKVNVDYNSNFDIPTKLSNVIYTYNNRKVSAPCISDYIIPSVKIEQEVHT